MGQDKASLEVRRGVRQLDYQVSLLSPFCNELAVCVGPTSRPKRTLPEKTIELFDVEAVSGPLAGVLAALRSAKGRAVLVVACDMPFLESSHLVQLLNRRDPEKLATCFLASDGKPDPMCCLYEASVLPLFEELVTAGRFSLRRFLADSDVEYIEPVEGDFLASVNNPDQLGEARQRLGDR